MPTATPSARLLRARLAVGDTEALETVRDALRRHGSATGAASEFGVSVATAQRWARLVGVTRPRGNPAWVPQTVTDAEKG